MCLILIGNMITFYLLLALLSISIEGTDDYINGYIQQTSGFIYYHTNVTLLLNGNNYTVLLDTLLDPYTLSHLFS